MSAARKLAGEWLTQSVVVATPSHCRAFAAEIDRTIKKIAEGLEAYDDMWDEVCCACTVEGQRHRVSTMKPRVLRCWIQRGRNGTACQKP